MIVFFSLHVYCYVCFAYVSAITESRIPRFSHRFVRNFFRLNNLSSKFLPWISSFNRSGIEPPSTSNSQAPHHLMRGPLRETYNPKSASMSSSNSSSTQQQQIQENIKCVFLIKTKRCIYSFRQL